MVHTNRDMIYADTAAEIEMRRKAFLRKWRLKGQAVADSLEEAGDRLFTFTRLDPSQWKSARTTNAIERLNEEFRCRIKTQTVLPCAETVPMLLRALLTSQILLNNFLSDFPSVAISTDRVDPEAVAAAPRWEIGRIRSYMILFGLVSTVFDLLTFGLLVHVFHATESLFQSTWFTVSLLTVLAVVLVLRTRRPSWRSRPGRVLAVSTLVVAGLAIALPYLGPVSRWFGLVPLPPHLLASALAIVALYIVATEIAKRRYYGAATAAHKEP